MGDARRSQLSNASRRSQCSQQMSAAPLPVTNEEPQSIEDARNSQRTNASQSLRAVANADSPQAIQDGSMRSNASASAKQTQNSAIADQEPEQPPAVRIT